MKAPARYTIAEVRRTYGAERAREEWYSDWASALIYRPLSFWLTSILLRLRVGASAVTSTTIVLALSFPVVAAALGPRADAAVAAMAFVCMVLDCADGNIARATGASSDFGAYLDFLADLVYRISLYATLGYIADAQGAAPAWLDGYGYALGALAACLAIGARLCRFSQGRPAAFTFRALDTPVRGQRGVLVRYVFPALSGSERMLPFYVLLTSAFGGLGWVLLWLLCLGVLDFAYTQVVIMRRLRGSS